MTDARERRLEMLQNAANESTKSKAIDKAVKYYLAMAGEWGRDGNVEQLMQQAIEQGSVTPEEIAETLDTNSLPVEYEREWAVGVDN